MSEKDKYWSETDNIVIDWTGWTSMKRGVIHPLPPLSDDQIRELVTNVFLKGNSVWRSEPMLVKWTPTRSPPEAQLTLPVSWVGGSLDGHSLEKNRKAAAQCTFEIVWLLGLGLWLCSAAAGWDHPQIKKVLSSGRTLSFRLPSVRLLVLPVNYTLMASFSVQVHHGHLVEALPCSNQIWNGRSTNTGLITLHLKQVG